MIWLAFENSRSPARIATLLPHTACALGTPRRTSASSMTSSWYSEPRCVSSSAAAAEMTSSVAPSPNCAVSSASIGRTRLPPASYR